MAFNEIPEAVRSPFTFIEFDNSGAIQGTTGKLYKSLLVGQMLPAGIGEIGVEYKITSDQQGEVLFGKGSMLAEQIKIYRKNDTSVALRVIAVADNEDGITSKASIKFVGTSTEAGVLNMHLGGFPVKALIPAGSDAPAVATIVKNKIESLNLMFKATIDVEDLDTVKLEFKHKGEVGNKIRIYFNYYDGELFPKGLASPVVSPFAGGLLNPDLSALIANHLPEIQYEAIVSPYLDKANLDLLDEEMIKRWGPVMQATGVVFAAKEGSYGELSAFGHTRNSRSFVCLEAHEMPTAPFLFAAAVTAAVMASISKDQARPVQTIVIKGVLPAKTKDLFKFEERNLLLYDGIATHKTDEYGTLTLDRVITTYKKSSSGADDESHLDIYPGFILDFLRFDYRNRLARKFPRHKLCDDGVQTLPDNTVTPSVIKGEAISAYKAWLALGLVENLDAFIESLIVERDPNNTNRLNHYLKPDLMNQLMINGVQLKWLL